MPLRTLAIHTLVFVFAFPAIVIPQSVVDKTQPAQSNSDRVCTQDRIICVPKATTNSLVNNPFRLDIQVNSGDDIYVAWEIKDSTGRVLESSSTSEYTDQPTTDFSLGRTLHVQAFISTPAKSDIGTLTLTPGRYTPRDGGVALPDLIIPIRLTRAISTVTILLPEDQRAYQNAVNTWVDGEHTRPSNFTTNSKLDWKQVDLMRFDRGAAVGATTEAVLRAWPGQGTWHVANWRIDGTTAHVTISGDAWLGVTYYAVGVDYLIERSVLALPGINKFVFDRAR